VLTRLESALALFKDLMSITLDINTAGEARVSAAITGTRDVLAAWSDDDEVLYGPPVIGLLRASLKLDLSLYELSWRRRLPSRLSSIVEPIEEEHRRAGRFLFGRIRAGSHGP